jgi:hypothetical protein
MPLDVRPRAGFGRDVWHAQEGLGQGGSRRCSRAGREPGGSRPHHWQQQHRPARTWLPIIWKPRRREVKPLGPDRRWSSMRISQD